MLLGLFGAGDGTVELLEETADGFFRAVYELLTRDFAVAASALTDPLKTSDKENLVIGQLSYFNLTSPLKMANTNTMSSTATYGMNSIP